jgi:hypothetical protein
MLIDTREEVTSMADTTKPKTAPRNVVTIRGKAHKLDSVTRPDALAVALNMSGKVLRGYLRGKYPIGTPVRNAMQPGGKASTWSLSRDAVKDAVSHFAPKA